MEFDNIFLISFYALMAVLFIVIVIPAMYSLLSKKKQIQNITATPSVDTSKMQVINHNSVHVANLAALTNSGTFESNQPATDFTSNVKSQSIPKAPKQPKFEVFNAAQESAGQQPVRNWSSHWN